MVFPKEKPSVEIYSRAGDDFNAITLIKFSKSKLDIWFEIDQGSSNLMLRKERFEELVTKARKLMDW